MSSWVEGLFRKVFSVSTELASLSGMFFTILALGLAVLSTRSHYDNHALDYAILVSVMMSGFFIGPVYGAVVGLFTAGFYGALIECSSLLTFMNCILRTLLLVISGMFAGSVRNLIYLLFRKIKKLSEVNPVTGLNNRNSAIEEIKDRRKSESNLPVDVLSFKVKNMENMRRKVGHKKADQLLAQYAKLISKQLGNNSHISQLSDDSLLAITQSKNPQDASYYQTQLSAIQQQTSQHEALKELELAAGLFRDESADSTYAPEQYLDIAYENMLQALALPDNFFASKGQPQTALTADAAQEKDPIQLRYQVILNVGMGSFTSLECLIVWQPENGSVFPLKKVLPQVRLSHEVDQLVIRGLDQFYRDCLNWKVEGKPLQLSINITPDDSVYESVVNHLIGLHNHHPELSRCISIGLSEKSLETGKKARTHAKLIKSLGYKITVHDLNVYRSDLMRLSGYNCDGYKIHGLYAESAIENSDRKARFDGFIKALRLTGKSVTFYAVETKPVFRVLRKANISDFQGKLISKPLEKAAIPWDRIKVKH